MSGDYCTVTVRYPAYRDKNGVAHDAPQQRKREFRVKHHNDAIDIMSAARKAGFEATFERRAFSHPSGVREQIERLAASKDRLGITTREFI